MTGRALVLRGDARNLPLPDESVDLVCTSPPYFGLRSYTDAGEHYAGQVGSEATPQEFLEALWVCTREWVRVLKPSGSIWVNLGDKYAAGHGGSSTEGNGVNINVGHAAKPNFRERDDLPNPPASWGTRDASGRAIVPGFRPKTLMGMPWRYALGCIDQLGLILRAEVVWSKPNGLPESVTDRVRRSHEQWFHFTRQPRYFAAVDEIREPQRHLENGRSDRGGAGKHSRANLARADQDHIERTWQSNALGKLPGSVWTIESGPWDGSISFCPRCGRNLTDAGNGAARETVTVTGGTGSPAPVTDEHTDLSTSTTAAHSHRDNHSTTSAVTAAALTPTTSSLSAGETTSYEATPSRPETSPRPAAITGMSSPPPTPTYAVTESGSVVCACGLELGRGGSAPPSVWQIPTEPLTVPDWLGVSHFAAFPLEFPLRIVAGWCPRGVCTVCGEGRRPVVDKQTTKLGTQNSYANRMAGTSVTPVGGGANRSASAVQDVRITGYACSCTPYTDHSGAGSSTRRESNPYGESGREQGVYSNKAGEYERVGPWREYHHDQWTPPPATPGVCLDPFGGTGTTALAAKALGRVGVTVDLSHDYSRLARWRTTDRGELAKAMRVEKPVSPVENQLEMFGMDG